MEFSSHMAGALRTHPVPTTDCDSEEHQNLFFEFAEPLCRSPTDPTEEATEETKLTAEPSSEWLPRRLLDSLCLLSSRVYP